MSQRYQTRSQALVLTVLGGFSLLTLIFFVWIFIVDGFREWWAPLVLLGMPLGFLVVCVRGTLAGVTFVGERVRIVNLFRTVWLRASEIEKFELGSHGITPGVAIAVLEDGRRIEVFGIHASNRLTRPKDHSAETSVEALNAELRRVRQESLSAQD